MLCAQGHAGAVIGLMVGFAVAGYTGIIERGPAAEQPRKAKLMTPIQNNPIQNTDEQQSEVAAPSHLERDVAAGGRGLVNSGSPHSAIPTIHRCPANMLCVACQRRNLKAYRGASTSPTYLLIGKSF